MHSSDSTRPTTVSLSRRIAAYATNLLVSGLVLLAALVFGSQVIAWWRVDEQQVASADHVATVVGPPLPISSGWMQFGDSTFDIHCSSLVGDEKTAFEQLRLRCRQAAISSPLFGAKPNGDELRLVLGLGAKKPIEYQRGQWSMYQMSEEIPMVVLVSLGQNSIAPVARFDSRVISLGIAFPRSRQRPSELAPWTLMVCAKLARSAADASVDQPTTPPGGRRIVAVTDDVGSQLCSWNGPGNDRQWRFAFDHWHRMLGWTPSSNWTETQQSSHRRYEHPTKGVADVQFTQLRDGSLTGYWTKFGIDHLKGKIESRVPHSGAPATAN